VQIVIVLVAVLVVACVLGLVIWIRRAASCTRRIGAPSGGESLAIFPGDVMCKYVLTGGSFARLEFFDWGLRLRGIAISRWIVPTWEAQYSELARADLITLPWSRMTVWLRVRDGSARIGFLTSYSREVMNRLEKHGVPVDRTVTQIGRIAELYDQAS
jgi:hypothetical protein